MDDENIFLDQLPGLLHGSNGIVNMKALSHYKKSGTIEDRQKEENEQSSLLLKEKHNG